MCTGLTGQCAAFHLHEPAVTHVESLRADIQRHHKYQTVPLIPKTVCNIDCLLASKMRIIHASPTCLLQQLYTAPTAVGSLAERIAPPLLQPWLQSFRHPIDSRGSRLRLVKRGSARSIPSWPAAKSRSCERHAAAVIVAAVLLGTSIQAEVCQRRFRRSRAKGAPPAGQSHEHFCAFVCQIVAWAADYRCWAGDPAAGSLLATDSSHNHCLLIARAVGTPAEPPEEASGAQARASMHGACTRPGRQTRADAGTGGQMGKNQHQVEGAEKPS